VTTSRDRLAKLNSLLAKAVDVLHNTPLLTPSRMHAGSWRWASLHSQRLHCVLIAC